jgi:demethoxyubiquinone hydroxylase (CLK1/Coq7/Cat5 family)
MQTTHTNDQTIDQLNSFLRGELSAVETYRQALSAVSSVPHRSTLELCERSHQSRVDILRQEVQRRGGEPAQGSGAWGTFAKAIEGTAKAMGEKGAIAALEEGEDHGREDYRRDIQKLDAGARQLIETQVLPEQLRTHDAISALKKQLS